VRLAALALLLLPTAALSAPTVGGCPVFPANHYWNTPVDTLPVHASSAAWVASIGATTRLHPDWGNVLADNFGIPFATVTGAQPRVPITFGPDGFADESDPGPMPIPPNAPVEGGDASTGDRHVLVVDTTNCILYELYRAFSVGGGASWQVDSSARFDLRSNALRPAGFTSADAAGFAIFPGLARYDEVAAGEIAHAIRFTASRIWGRSGGSPFYLWPARHWSGNSTDSTRPPMGARFRLKADFDISRFDARTQVVLRAFKKYGLVLADAGSDWFFQGVSDTRWPDGVLDELKSISGGSFEAVDTAVLLIDANSAEARVPPTSPPPPPPPPPVTGANYQALWWRAPAGSENGWGVNITHQGDILFATWFTYDTDGSGLWLVMPAGTKTGEGAYAGLLYRTTGAPFDATPWNPTLGTVATVGSAAFSFSDANSGTFTYTVNGITQSKPITRQVFANPVPTCTAGGAAGAAPNYQDLWWRSPAGSENGWGVNITHQGDTLFATWFTYDAAGRGQWLVMSNGVRTGAATYSGALDRTRGPPFDSVPWSIAPLVVIPAGSATFAFTDAANGTFTYTVDGVTQAKPITRQVYSTPATACR
jgi:hypothetical protein